MGKPISYEEARAKGSSMTQKSVTCVCHKKLTFAGSVRGGSTTRCPGCGRDVIVPR